MNRISVRLGDVETLEKAVEAVTGVEAHHIKGVSRIPEFSAARHVLWYILSKSDLAWPMTQIARRYDVDHTSVIYGVKKVKASTGLMSTAAQAVDEFNRIMEPAEVSE